MEKVFLVICNLFALAALLCWMRSLSDTWKPIIEFKEWLDESGRGYLADGLRDKPVGEALLGIFRRAGITDIGTNDIVKDTLPRARKFIEENCPPKVPA